MLADGSGTEACQASTNPDDSCRFPVLAGAGRASLGGWMDGWTGRLQDGWLGGWSDAWLVRHRTL